MATASPTAFQPATATPTLGTIALWVAPGVPDALRFSIERAARGSAGMVQLVDEAGQAHVRFEANPEVPLASWIYAVVAPFPTIRDGLTRDELLAAWSSGPMLVSTTTANALEAQFGPSTPGALRLVSPEALLDQAWAAPSSLAVVPFESLEPRWKVLEIDGASPVRREFDPTGYPLAIPFGLSGHPGGVAYLRDRLQSQTEPPWPATNRDPSRLTVLVMTGVTALTRATAATMESQGITYPATAIEDWLRQADITHVSNEVSFAPNCPTPDPAQRSLRFCSLPSHASLFDEIGVDVIELTGNHVMDWGPAAFLYSLDLYQAHGWRTYGGGASLEEALAPALFEHNGNRLAFIGCNSVGPPNAWAAEGRPGAAPCLTERLFDRVAQMRAEGILPIFSFQWAESARSSPLPDQVAGFRAAIDAGAAIVSGSQAHQAQSYEFYAGGFIHYGLGNLFFDQMDSLATRRELIDCHVFYEGRHISTEVLTAMLEDYAQPRPMTASERADFLQMIFAASGW